MTRETIGLAIVLVGLIVIAAVAISSRRERKRADERRAARAARKPLSAAASNPGQLAIEPPPPPRPALQAPPPPTPIPTSELPSLNRDQDDDDEITLITLKSKLTGVEDAVSDDEDDDDIAAATRAHPILFDEEAASDEPTGPVAFFLLSACAVSDRGRVRRRNEDSYLTDDEAGLYVVADGMGGYAGGDVASQLAVDTMAHAFRTSSFGEARWPSLPRRAKELASAVGLANLAVFEKSREDPKLAGMGTTGVAARFSSKKERLYIGHVGDSRCYRIRGGKMSPMTQDHTLASVGVGGPVGNRLVRAVGIGRHVEIDLVIARPLPGDVYLLCSDGLTKMASDAEIGALVERDRDPAKTAEALVELAISHGGKDNVTVVVVRVERGLGP
jgi:serine/threonine protein phosphatase PrpC